MAHLFQFCLARLAVILLAIFPITLSTWCAKRVGDLWYLFGTRRRRVAFSNVNRVFGHSISHRWKRGIVHKSFQNGSISLMELFLFKKIKKEASRRFSISGAEHLQQALAKGKGVVLVIAHLGSWEYLSFLPDLVETKCSVIVKKIKNPYFDREVNLLRMGIGGSPIAKSNSIREVLSELKKKNIVAIMIDQWAGREGIWVDFFGGLTSTTSLPVRLARKTGCALIPVYCLRRSPGFYQMEIHAPVEVQQTEEMWEHKTTLKLNQLLEEQIRTYPEQWSWMHRRWKAKPALLRIA